MSWNEELSVCKDVTGKYGYIDKQGGYVIKPHFDEAQDFSEGSALIKMSEKWYFIDKTGTLLSKSGFDFDEVKIFYDGFAPVRKGEKWNFIDKTGTLLSKSGFDEVQFFFGGLAAVRVGKKWGYIDKTSNFVVTPQFDSANPFVDGVGRVTVGGKDVYIDQAGKYTKVKSYQVKTAESVDVSLGVITGADYILPQGKSIYTSQFQMEHASNLSREAHRGWFEEEVKTGQITFAPTDIPVVIIDECSWCSGHSVKVSATNGDFKGWVYKDHLKKVKKAKKGK